MGKAEQVLDLDKNILLPEYKEKFFIWETSYCYSRHNAAIYTNKFIYLFLIMIS